MVKDPQGTTLLVRRTVAAPPETVFRAWTDPEWFARWFGAPDGTTTVTELDARVGGAYRIEVSSSEGSGCLFGTYLEVARPERLVYTFCWEGLPVEIAETRVTVEFHDRGDATEIVLTHERQPTPGVHAFHEHGWTMSLDRLASLVATR